MGLRLRAAVPGLAAALKDSWQGNQSDEGEGRLSRIDLRLVPAAMLAWGSAIAGAYLEAGLLLLLSAALFLFAAVLLGVLNPLLNGKSGPRRRRSAGGSRGRGANARKHTLRATIGLACLVATCVCANAAARAGERDGGPVATAAAERSAVVAEVTVTGPPRRLDSRSGNQSASSGRWAVPVRILHFRAGGRTLKTDAGITVMGSGSWGGVVPGQRLRVAGKLTEPGHGRPEAAVLSVLAQPSTLETTEGLDLRAAELRKAFREASKPLPEDAAGLLPGMVTGDTESLGEDLESAMKTVGMTHLTAVSGANCSLVMGSLLLLARSIRLSRPLAACVAVLGLCGFAFVVGPDPSVLRASLMGAIGVISLAAGRRGRSLGFLCLAVIGLLLLNPALGVTFGFLLSVLATLGIVLLGRRLTSWLHAFLPLPLAAAFAVSLSAQLLCSPVIVALQPGFLSYALIANVVAAPFVAPVTLLGTAALALLPVWSAAAQGLMTMAGVSAGCVSAIARFFASSPAATLPWPEGPAGMFSMAVMSFLTFTMVWIITHPLSLLGGIQWLHSCCVQGLERTESWLHRKLGRRRPWEN